MRKYFLVFVYIAVVAFFLFILLILYSPYKNEKNIIPFLNESSVWADSVLNKMSAEEKIGQLLYIELNQVQNIDSLSDELMKIKPAALAFNTDITQYRKLLSKKMIDKSGLPVFMSFGLNTKNVINGFPSYLTLNAVTNDSLKQEYASLLSGYLANSGINMFFIDCEPISSFHVNDSAFAFKYINEIKSMADSLNNYKILTGILLNSPLPGDKFKADFFKRITARLKIVGISSVFSNQDSVRTGFNGLNICKYTEKSDLKQIISSNTDLIYINDSNKHIYTELVNLYKSGAFAQKEIDKKLRKILLAKKWIFTQKKEVPDYYAHNNTRQEVLNYNLLQSSVTLIKNKGNYLPVTDLQNLNPVCLFFSESGLPQFEKSLNNYLPITLKSIDTKKADLKKTILSLKDNNLIIIALNKPELDTAWINGLETFNTKAKVIWVNFGNIQNIKYLNKTNRLVQIYGNSLSEQQLAAEAIFGGIGMKGVIPVAVTDTLGFGYGLTTNKIRLQTTIPEVANVDSKILARVDTIVYNAICEGAFPGCQVFVARHGKIIFNKAYGYQSYAGGSKVSLNDLYDIASVTKITATTVAAMKMLDQQKMKLDDPLGNYFNDKRIEYTRIKPDTTIYNDTLNIKQIKDLKKAIKNRDTLRLNDSLIIAYDTIIQTSTPSNNIFKVTVRELLRHQSGITPAMPIIPLLFYRYNYFLASRKKSFTNRDLVNFDMNKFNEIKGANDNPEAVMDSSADKTENLYKDYKMDLRKAFEHFYSDKYDKDSSPVQIAENFYLKKNYFDTLWRDTKQLLVSNKKHFIYSDVNMILLQMAIDSVNNMPMSVFMNDNFYAPLGMKTTCYMPLTKFEKRQIVPTEEDKFWRGQLLRGYVHDPSAAMIGGIAGNAGLFSSAQDLGILYQMLLNGGSYGGKKYLEKQTIDLFTKFQEESSRGLGFDKPSPKGIIAASASPESYGHTGFTGCCVWVDPVNDLVYVFLSNRVHPSQKNGKINGMRVRQNIHQAIYDAMTDKK